MRRTRWTRKKFAAAAAAVTVAVSGGVAYAFWTASGSGSGSATTSTPAALTVVQTSTNSGLAPGGSTALAGTISNPNSSPVTVSTLTASVTAFSVPGDTSKPACTQADFSISGTATVASPIAANSTGGGAWSGLSLNMTNSASNQDNCKGVTVPIAYVVS